MGCQGKEPRIAPPQSLPVHPEPQAMQSLEKDAQIHVDVCKHGSIC